MTDAVAASSENAAQQPRALYDAFISYSHAKDKPIASALQGVMQRLGKPWHKRRALRIFRDDTSLAATPELWPSIEQALSQSRYLIVLASPQFAASKWCSMEVAYWLEHKSLDTLLIALTEGELVWDDAQRDFWWSDATPLPPHLRGKFRSEPKWIDLRAHRESPEHRDAKLIDSAADLAAAVHGIPKEDLLSQEVRQQKRALALAWSAAAVLLALTGAAGWQWFEADRARRAAVAAAQVATEQKVLAQKAEEVATEQKVLAQKAEAQAASERDRAEKNLALARQAAGGLVFKIAQGLRNVRGMRVDSIRQILEIARGVMDELVKSAPDDPELQHSRAAMLVEFARTYVAIGDLERARAAAEESLGILRKLTAHDPDDAKGQHDLSVVLNGIGDIRRATGDLDGAREAHEESLAIMRRVVAMDASDSEFHRGLAVSLQKAGEVRRDVGDHAGALAAYEESLAIIRRLARADSGNAGWRRDLSVMLSKVGDVRREIGDSPGALAAYSESLDIARELAAADPGNAEWQIGLGVSLERVGDMRRDAGDRDGALAAHEESLAIRRKLAELDPGNLEWQNLLGVSLEKVGHLRLSVGDRDGARAVYEESLAIRRKLAATDPGNFEWQRNLSYTLRDLGDVQLDSGDRDGARATYEESLVIARKLANRANPQSLADLAFSLAKISLVSDRRRASEAIREAIAIVEELERAGTLSAAQREWPRIFREMLAILTPEAGGGSE